MNRFDFSEFGRVYININIKPHEGVTMSPIRFKVDTGADKTTLQQILRIL